MMALHTHTTISITTARSLLLAAVMALSGLNATAPAQIPTLSPQIAASIEKSEASDAFWSIVVRDSSGRMLQALNPEKLVRPASNLKLLTSAAILEQLGPEYSYETVLYGIGRQEGAVWKGDLLIRGSGDPSISGTLYGGNRFHVFEQFSSVLDSMGVRRISGNLIGNTSFFDGQPYPKGWAWEDLSFYYGVETSALSFNENAVDLTVRADGKVGSTPAIEWFPYNTDYVTFVNEQVISPASSEYDEFYQRILGTNTVMLGSSLPQGYVEKEALSIMDAPRFFIDSFKKFLEQEGIAHEGGLMVDDQEREWADPSYVRIASHRSHPLEALIKEVNKKSSNFFTEMLLKTIASERFGDGGSTESGLALVREFAASAGIDTVKMNMSDGSGMSPATLITAGDLSRLLVELQHRSYFDAYRNSLSRAGVDGSLGHRFRGTPLAGQLYGKSGYVSGVRAISGYMRSAGGKRLVFSIVTNNYTVKTSHVDSLHEEILLQLYRSY